MLLWYIIPIEKVRTVRFSKTDQEVKRAAPYVGTPITGMRFSMKFGKVDFPKPLLDALRDNKLVVFAGAGVSMGEPACLPNFESLTKLIADGTGITKCKSENLEQFLGRLADRGVKVHHLAKTELSREGAKPAPLHRDLLRLYRKDQSIRLVTTNFDLLFEQAAESIYDTTPEVFHAPQLPFGDQLNGIIHIHGSISYPDQMVLTDSDFGRAYLREASVTRFLFDLYDRYTFLFVGYSHSDTVMNYLVRALPPQSAGFPRYALEREAADDQRWKRLGIEKIPYPENHENDHSELEAAICELANYLRRGMMDWHRVISEIAESPPSELDEEDERDIALAFEDEAKTRFFTENASHPEWIDWLDERGHLTRLFGNGPLQDSDRVLSWWLVAQYLEDYSHQMFLLIGRHRTRLHPIFWNYIAQKIGSDKWIVLDTTFLSRWTSLLLSTAPEEGKTPDGGYVYTSNHLTEIAQRCIEHQLVKEVLLIFDMMVRSRVSIMENQYIPSGAIDRDLQISLEIPTAGRDDDLNKLWCTSLRPHVSKIASPLLERAIHCLENEFTLYHVWGRATRLSEPASQSRSAIEPHEQDEQRGRDKNDVLIDAARDCLEWLASNQPKVAAQWCNRLVASDEPLLRRLAVHTLPQRTDLTADAKIQWLLEHVDFHEYVIHHEVYLAVQHSYPEASTDSRMALIERIQSSAI